jgi:hypothetical protein
MVELSALSGGAERRLALDCALDAFGVAENACGECFQRVTFVAVLDDVIGETSPSIMGAPSAQDAGNRIT